MKRLLSLIAVLGLLASAQAAPETFKIDPVHSTVNFSLRHIVSKFTGGFTKLAGTITYDAAAPEQSAVEATVEIGSINTNDAKRDAHALSPDFLNGAKFPTASFKSKSWKKTGESHFDVLGDLTIAGVTKEVTFKVELLGVGPGMGGATVSGWEATAVINKNDFGVVGPAMLSKALGENVTIVLGVEAGYKKG